MATFRCAAYRALSIGGFHFQNNQLSIPDSDPDRIAKFRELWSKQSAIYRNAIVEVQELGVDGRNLLEVAGSKVVRGIDQAGVQKPRDQPGIVGDKPVPTAVVIDSAKKGS